MCRLVRWFEKNVHLSVYLWRVFLFEGETRTRFNFSLLPLPKTPSGESSCVLLIPGPVIIFKSCAKKSVIKNEIKKGAERKYIMSENTDIADDVEVHNAPVYTIIPVYKTLTYKPF